MFLRRESRSHLGHKFEMTIVNPAEVKGRIGYKSLEFKREGRTRDLDLGINNIWTGLKTRRSDVTKRISINRDRSAPRTEPSQAPLLSRG